jgi:molybdopterin converting factor subunit 1
MQVTIRLFAVAKERAGRSEVVIDLPSTPTVADLRAALRDQIPELRAIWSRALIAVDQEYADDNREITSTSQLAVIPPVSGGAETQPAAMCSMAQTEGSRHR